MTHLTVTRWRSGLDDEPVKVLPKIAQLGDGQARLVSRRAKAFVADLVVFAVLLIAVVVLVSLYAPIAANALTPFLPFLLLPLTMLYFAAAQGGRRGASPGMRLFNLTLRRRDGARAGFKNAFYRTVAFYLSVTLLSPLVLLVLILSRGKRALHDYVMGTVIIDTAH